MFGDSAWRMVNSREAFATVPLLVCLSIILMICHFTQSKALLVHILELLKCKLTLH